MALVVNPRLKFELHNYFFSLSLRTLTFEPPHDKSNKMAGAPSKDSDQPGHPPSLISLRCPHEESLVPKLPIECTAKTDQTGRMPRLI